MIRVPIFARFPPDPGRGDDGDVKLVREEFSAPPAGILGGMEQAVLEVIACRGNVVDFRPELHRVLKKHLGAAKNLGSPGLCPAMIEGEVSGHAKQIGTRNTGILKIVSHADQIVKAVMRR